MGIRGRTLAVISVIIAVQLAVLVAGISFSTGQTASRIEERDVGDALARAQAILGNEGRECALAAADWSQWTDTYNYVVGKMPSYPAANLNPSSITNLGVDFIAFIDERGHVVSATAIDQDHKPEAPPTDLVTFLASKPTVLNLKRVGSSTSGLFADAKGVWVLGMSPITNNDASAPSDGVLVTGRWLGPGRIAQIESTLLAPISLTVARTKPPAGIDAAHWRTLQSGATAMTPTANDRISGSRLLSGIRGAHDILLSVTIPRVAKDLSAEALRNSGIAFVVFALIMILGVSLAIETNVLRRLKLLSDGVRSIGPQIDLAERIRIGGHDEIADVADNINVMLDELEESHTDLAYLASHDPLTRLYNRRRFEIASSAQSSTSQAEARSSGSTSTTSRK